MSANASGDCVTKPTGLAGPSDIATESCAVLERYYGGAVYHLMNYHCTRNEDALRLIRLR